MEINVIFVIHDFDISITVIKQGELSAYLIEYLFTVNMKCMILRFISTEDFKIAMGQKVDLRFWTNRISAPIKYTASHISCESWANPTS